MSLAVKAHPLVNLNRACQPCHAVPEKELEARVLTIQDRHHALLQRAGRAATDMLDAGGAARKAGASEEDLKAERQSPGPGPGGR